VLPARIIETLYPSDVANCQAAVDNVADAPRHPHRRMRRKGL